MLIPARYESSRFPGKPLAPLKNKPMISHVYERTQKLSEVQGFEVTVAVVTDDDRIEEHLKNEEKCVVRVDDPVESGTERIHLAWKRHFGEEDFDFIINVQGDEPLIEKEDLKELVEFHHQSSFDIATVVQEKEIDQEFNNPNRVKAVFDEKTGQCFYFSRAAIPMDRDGGNLKHWHLHIGLYCYRAQALEKFCKNPMGSLEKIEKLEQLRALGLGMTIGATRARHPFLGVDTPEDIASVEGVLE